MSFQIWRNGNTVKVRGWLGAELASGEVSEETAPLGVELPENREDIAVMAQRVAASLGDFMSIRPVIVDGPQHFAVWFQVLGQHRGRETDSIELPLRGADRLRAGGKEG